MQQGHTLKAHSASRLPKNIVKRHENAKYHWKTVGNVEAKRSANVGSWAMEFKALTPKNTVINVKPAPKPEGSKFRGITSKLTRKVGTKRGARSKSRSKRNRK
jgi:hypothetical protein